MSLLEIDVGDSVVAAIATGDTLPPVCGRLSKGDWVEVRGELHVHNWMVKQREHSRVEITIEEVKCVRKATTRPA